MCGLTGGWSRQRFQDLLGSAPRMSGSLAHRGPDGEGCWSDADAGIVLCHRRLAIVDLSPAGQQPMVSANGRWVIAFNGEIYNHLELRRDLDGAASHGTQWRGHSDTETLLAAIDAWGLEAALERCVGMFALAVWDRDRRELWLARDRFGEKPLYFGWNRGVFLFGSELKALRAMQGFDARIDRSSIASLMRYSAVPAPFSIYEGIGKLLPGHLLQLGADDLESGRTPASHPYWTAAGCASAARRNPFVGSDEEAADELEQVLGRAIAGQMVADVPLGAFLSGGIDSSLVVALMQKQSSQPVRTFSIGFREDGYDEARYAKAVADHLRTSHTELYVSPADALAMIPALPTTYDEPFADSSQIPTMLVARLARRNVTVALSGDGGDELFGGYRRYLLTKRLWSRIGRIPRPLRRGAAGLMQCMPVKAWNRAYGAFAPILPKRHRWALPGDKIHKGAAVLGAPDGAALYRGLVSHWEPRELVLGAEEHAGFGPPVKTVAGDLLASMMLEDTCHYLPDDILAKVDRAAMACSLETRVPLLDHRVFEFAWRLPMERKVRDGTGKLPMRRVLERHVPRHLIDRPKMGFGVPIGDWLSGPLRDWAAALLDPSRLRQQGYLDPGPIIVKWNEHLSGKRNWQYHLWDVLMFQAWLEETPA